MSPDEKLASNLILSEVRQSTVEWVFRYWVRITPCAHKFTITTTSDYTQYWCEHLNRTAVLKVRSDYYQVEFINGDLVKHNECFNINFSFEFDATIPAVVIFHYLSNEINEVELKEWFVSSCNVKE